MLANEPRLMAKSENYVAKFMESLVVIKVAVGVKIAELVSFHLDHDEPFKKFATLFEVKQKLVQQKLTTASECE